MKKYCIVILIVILTLCLFVSCNPNKQEDKPTPLFPSGTIIPQPTYDMDKFTGTYLLSKGIEAYAYVSFDSSGTAVVVPVTYFTHPSSETISYGTWYEDGSNTGISILGKDLTVSGYTSSSSGVRNGFYCDVSYISTWYFTKASDDLINVDVYSDKSILCGKAWGKTDDYGYTKGYKFNTDGTCIYHANETGLLETEPYKIAVNKPLILIGDDPLMDEDRSYVLVGNYLYIGLTAYGCYGATVPIKTTITGTNLSVDKVKGMYALEDPSTGKGTGYCCLSNTGKYWQEIDGVQSEGNWRFEGAKGIICTINGQFAKTYRFESNDKVQQLEEGSYPYASAVKISTLVDYSYGIYEGSELQVKNTVVGNWFSTPSGTSSRIGFTFNSDYSAIVYAYNPETKTWNGSAGFTWSYSAGKVTIASTSFNMSFLIATATSYDSYPLHTEMYLNGVVFTHNQ